MGIQHWEELLSQSEVILELLNDAIALRGGFFEFPAGGRQAADRNDLGRRILGFESARFDFSYVPPFARNGWHIRRRLDFAWCSLSDRYFDPGLIRLAWNLEILEVSHHEPKALCCLSGYP